MFDKIEYITSGIKQLPISSSFREYLIFWHLGECDKRLRTEAFGCAIRSHKTNEMHNSNYKFQTNFNFQVKSLVFEKKVFIFFGYTVQNQFQNFLKATLKTKQKKTCKYNSKKWLLRESLTKKKRMLLHTWHNWKTYCIPNAYVANKKWFKISIYPENTLQKTRVKSL